MTAVKTYEFSLVLSEVPTEGVVNRLYESGCADVLVGVQCGVAYVDFDRQAKSLEEAILSAVHVVERAGLGLSQGN